MSCEFHKLQQMHQENILIDEADSRNRFLVTGDLRLRSEQALGGILKLSSASPIRDDTQMRWTECMDELRPVNWEAG